MQQDHQNLESDPHATSALTAGNKLHMTVLGDFEIHREIGRGGMGTVYEALQVSLQRVVALKVLAPHVASTSKAVSRFRREAQAAAKLHHTHIVPIFAQGEAEGSYFYAMELVEGESLHAVIMNLRSQHRPEAATDQAETVVLPQRSASTATTTKKIDAAAPSDSAVRKSGSLPAKSQAFGSDDYFLDAARHLADVADALEYAHLNGVIHRDIKPHNLLFGRDSRLRISDFGLARLAEQPGVTMTGEVLGSPLYMSPEQITGDPAGVDHRTDIYSLGATMYEWLTLNPPYPGETRERVISKILSTEPLPPRSENPAVPHDLETICLKAIDRDLSRRYQTAGEMRDDLRRFLLSRPIVARRAGTMVRAMRFVVRHQIAALLTAALLVGSGLLWALYSKDRRVKVEQAEAVKAKAEVVEAKEAIVNATSEKEILFKAMLSAVLPGGAAIAEKVADQDFSKTGLPTDAMANLTWKIGTPSEIALQAVGDFYQAVADPNWPAQDGGMSEGGAAMVNRAIDRWVSGDARGADQILRDYFAQDPKGNSNPDAVQLRVALNAVLGQFDAMLIDANVLLGAEEKKSVGYVWRGLARLLLNNIEPSLSDLNLAGLSSKSMWPKLFRGFALLQADNAAEAKKSFDEALERDPSSKAAHLGRARALTAEENYPEALKEVDEVLKADPRNVHALTIRGECRTATGDIDGALRDFREAMSIAGYLPELAFRYYLVSRSRETGQEAAKVPVGTEVKSRHGTEPEDKSAPPVFKWLRQRLPESESGAMQPESSVLPWASFRFPLPR